MNILVSSINNDNHSNSRQLRNVLKRLGHDVVWITIPRIGTSYNLGDYPEPGFAHGTMIEDIIAFAGVAPDLFVYTEPLGLIPEGMERVPFPTVCLLCDMHNNLGIRVNIARFFDYVISHQRNYVQSFSEHPAGHVTWLPLALDAQEFYPHIPIDGKRDFEVAFVGKTDTPERKEMISALIQRYKMNPIRGYLQKEIPEIYSRSKIVLNFPRADDVNYRVFEAMSVGAMLLTKRVQNGMDDLFTEGVHFVGFDTSQEMYAQIDYYLSHELERQAIAKAGLTEFQQYHNLEYRVSSVLEFIFKTQEKVAPVRAMTSFQLDRTYTSLYETWYHLDPILRRIGTAKQEKRPWLHMFPSVIRMILRYLLGRLPVHYNQKGTLPRQ